MLETVGVVTLITLIIVSPVITLAIRKVKREHSPSAIRKVKREHSPSAIITRKPRLEHPERIKLKR